MAVPPVMLDAVLNALGMRETVEMLRSPMMQQTIAEAVHAIATFDRRLSAMEKTLADIARNLGVEPADWRDGFTSNGGIVATTAHDANGTATHDGGNP